jgi:flagellar biosynthetic protein FliQ
MEVQQAIDLGREAIMITLLVGSPVLLSGMIVALVVGLLQALTQVQEQTVSFVPKIVAMILALSLSLPWVAHHMLDYVRQLIVNIPATM